MTPAGRRGPDRATVEAGQRPAYEESSPRFCFTFSFHPVSPALIHANSPLLCFWERQKNLTVGSRASTPSPRFHSRLQDVLFFFKA